MWMRSGAEPGDRSSSTIVEPVGTGTCCETCTRPVACATGRARVRMQPRLRQLLRDALRLQVQQQVVAPSRLAVGAAHVEATERVAAHHGAGALAVQVQVADEELVARPLPPRCI